MKGKRFVFQAILTKDVQEGQIRALLPGLIMQQQNQYSNMVQSVNNIKIHNFTYVDSKPDNWLVVADWELV